MSFGYYLTTVLVCRSIYYHMLMLWILADVNNRSIKDKDKFMLILSFGTIVLLALFYKLGVDLPYIMNMLSCAGLVVFLVKIVFFGSKVIEMLKKIGFQNHLVCFLCSKVGFV